MNDKRLVLLLEATTEGGVKHYAARSAEFGKPLTLYVDAYVSATVLTYKEFKRRFPHIELQDGAGPRTWGEG